MPEHHDEFDVVRDTAYARWRTRTANRLFRRRYPKRCKVPGPNMTTVEMVSSLPDCRVVAEIGVYEGHTSVELARVLAPRGGTLHLFDFDDRVDAVRDRLHADGIDGVVAHGNSRLALDSYNWSLMTVMRDQPDLTFDYVFFDGAHVWVHDALAFLLADRVLRPGGHVDFDDVPWTLESSNTLNSYVFPRTAQSFTAEQIETPQISLVLDLLVRPDGRYVEVIPEKVFRKVRA